MNSPEFKEMVNFAWIIVHVYYYLYVVEQNLFQHCIYFSTFTEYICTWTWGIPVIPHSLSHSQKQESTLKES